MYTLIFSCYRSSNFVADFKLPGNCFVCIITEADYISECKNYRVSLAKFYKSYRNLSTVVICVRTEAAITDFDEVQTFCVIELGLPLILIADLDQVPQLLSQLVLVRIFNSLLRLECIEGVWKA